MANFIEVQRDYDCAPLIISNSTSYLSTVEILALMRKQPFYSISSERGSKCAHTSRFLCGYNLYIRQFRASHFTIYWSCEVKNLLLQKFGQIIL